MTPRNLVPSTPMRFNPTEEISKKPQVKEKKLVVPLPPGYVDRAAQRRQGLEVSLNFEDLNVSKKQLDNDDEKKPKLLFLEESSNGFPKCLNESSERIMNLILKTLNNDSKCRNDNFKPNEAFLQFKSIDESKTQPFDPFCRPKKVFRAKRSKANQKDDQSNFDDEKVLESVKEAVNRLKLSTERNQKYLEALEATATTTTKNEALKDIFPDAGIFNEKEELDSIMKMKSLDTQVSSKSKAKARLFGSTSKKQTSFPEQTEEIDVFDFIAQKSLENSGTKDKKDENLGGLFGISDFLPKLSRLDSKETNSKLSSAYASILSDGGEELESSEFVKKEKILNEDEDDYLYPGHLENDPIAFDSDEEEMDNEPEKFSNGKGQKRKLARKEDKEAVKVEKLVKSKFGVDLTK